MPFYRAHKLPERTGWTSTPNLQDREFPWNPSTDGIEVWIGPVCPYTDMVKVRIPRDAIVATKSVQAFIDADSYITIGFDLKIYTVVATHKVEILQTMCEDEVPNHENRVLAHFDIACNVIIPEKKQYLVGLGPNCENKVIELVPTLGIPCINDDDNDRIYENKYIAEITPDTIAIKWKNVVEFDEVVLIKRIEA